ncbi:hypothetical protein D9X30_3891 [Cupriavidus sp. U2]|uniref:hypothetical protein n=1 Tax=Cupriavidus sp. U2 TaxID=2920269 RepID=UPI00129D61FC|nr:hypothetical protein [Cupriavidus sp. U2]KAI3591210.1 hypothetical protein D9X30_3891 [Cupriavidus sp. U2]
MPQPHTDTTVSDSHVEPDQIHEPRLWRDKGWTARVIKNEDGDGWAVEMIRDGSAEPALVGPWTMGRNKVDPKPLDATAHQTLVKTASEVIRRHEQQLHAQLNKQITIEVDDQVISVKLAITPDEFEPFGTLTATSPFGDVLATTNVRPDFRLTRESAGRWAADGFGKIR